MLLSGNYIPFAPFNFSSKATIAASFAFAGKDIIPDIFNSLVKYLNVHFPLALVKLIYYLERHV